jgi:hypothetical protein
MGKQRAEQQGTASGYGDGIHLISDKYSTALCNIVCLQILYSDNLICVHEYAFRYNKSTFNSTLEVALMIRNRSINGEVPYVC